MLLCCAIDCKKAGLHRTCMYGNLMAMHHGCEVHREAYREIYHKDLKGHGAKGTHSCPKSKLARRHPCEPTNQTQRSSEA